MFGITLCRTGPSDHSHREPVEQATPTDAYEPPVTLRNTILQDLRSVPGPTTDAYVKLDFGLYDVLMDAAAAAATAEGWDSVSEQILRQPVLDKHSQRSKTSNGLSQGDASRLDCPDESLVLLEPPQYRPASSLAFLPYSRSTHIVLVVFYSLAVLLHSIYLCVMHFQLYPLGVHDGVEHLSTSGAFLFSWKKKNPPEMPATPPEISWTSFYLDPTRFDVFFAIACLPIPFIFGVILICAARRLRRSVYSVLLGIAERLRRKINITSRQALDYSIDDYIRRVEFFFETRSDLKNIGVKQLHQELHRWLNRMHVTVLRYQPETTLALASTDSPLQRCLKLEAARAWAPIFNGYFVLPMLLTCLVDFGAVIYVSQSIMHGVWTPEKQDLRFFLKRPLEAVQNEGTEVCWRVNAFYQTALQWITVMILFHVLTWGWLLVILADDFTLWVLDTPGIFLRVATAGVMYINGMVKRLWEVVIIQNILSYVIDRKNHNLLRGTADEQVSRSSGKQQTSNFTLLDVAENPWPEKARIEQPPQSAHNDSSKEMRETSLP